MNETYLNYRKEKIEKHLDTGVFYSKADLKNSCGYLTDIYMKEVVDGLRGHENLQNFINNNIKNNTFEVIIRKGYFDTINFNKKVNFAKGETGNVWFLDLPYELYQIRNEHIEVVNIIDEKLGQRLKDLVEMRNIFKGFEIIKRPVKETFEKKVKTAITNWLDKEEKDEAKALRFTEIFGKLNITTNVHRVWYWGNKHYIRTFWYVDGELTRFAIIQQAYTEAVRQGIIKETN